MKIATSPFVYWGVAVFMPEKLGNLQGATHVGHDYALPIPRILLGTDPAKPLILLAQIAICPESRPRYLAFACPEETLRRARPHAPPRALPRPFARPGN